MFNQGATMHESSFFVPALVIVALLIASLLTIFQYRVRIFHALKRFESMGMEVKELKDVLLDRGIRLIIIPADVLTAIRPVFICGSMLAFQQQWFTLATALFVTGWLTDLLDGPKARHEAQLRGQPTRHGPFMDPGADIVCDLLALIWLGSNLSKPLAIAFGATVTVRALYGSLAIIKAIWPHILFRVRLMPESIAGKFKRVPIVLAFGLIIVWPNEPTAIIWANGTFALATFFEAISLIQQAWRVRKLGPNLQLVSTLRKTGSE